MSRNCLHPFFHYSNPSRPFIQMLKYFSHMVSNSQSYLRAQKNSALSLTPFVWQFLLPDFCGSSYSYELCSSSDCPGHWPGGLVYLAVLQEEEAQGQEEGQGRERPGEDRVGNLLFRSLIFGLSYKIAHIIERL